MGMTINIPFNIDQGCHGGRGGHGFQKYATNCQRIMFCKPNVYGKKMVFLRYHGWSFFTYIYIHLYCNKHPQKEVYEIGYTPSNGMMSWPMVFVMGWFKKIRFTRNNDEVRGWCKHQSLGV
jgi:hypothetical protein